MVVKNGTNFDDSKSIQQNRSIKNPFSCWEKKKDPVNKWISAILGKEMEEDFSQTCREVVWQP